MGRLWDWRSVIRHEIYRMCGGVNPPSPPTIKCLMTSFNETTLTVVQRNTNVIRAINISNQLLPTASHVFVSSTRRARVKILVKNTPSQSNNVKPPHVTSQQGWETMKRFDRLKDRSRMEPDAVTDLTSGIWSCSSEEIQK
ncbi:hypothetical protein J6590_051801 [Homalodisca vitripennis]|nr:hypothetical protein J6590_051801 [Homalodisca vitripennis]